MATASSADGSVNASAENAQPKRKSKRRKTSHLKLVPDSKDLRETIRDKCQAVCKSIDKSRPMTKDEMEVEVRKILEELELPEGYLGWMMVMFASEFWRDQVAAVPHNRRLFLLPHCLDCFSNLFMPF